MDSVKNFFIACIAFLIRIYVNFEMFLGVNKKLARENQSILKNAMKILGSKALRQIFHGPPCSYPRDKKKLYQELDKHRNTLNEYVNKGRLTRKQFETLLPPTKQETDSAEFDVSLLFALLSSTDVCMLLRIPIAPLPSDTSDEANAVRIHQLRNQLYSSTAPINYSDRTQLKNIWSDFSKSCQQILTAHQREIDVHGPMRHFLLRKIKVTLLAVLPATGEWILTKLIDAWQQWREYLASKRPREQVVIRERTDNVDMFVKRQSLLDNFISEILQKKQSQVGLALTGFGGVGKTETARAICNTLNNTDETVYENIIWIAADDKDKLNTNLKILFGKLDFIEETPEHVRVVAHKIYQKLQGTKTLIVLDNVTKSDDVEDILPGENFTDVFIIITSQWKKWPSNQFIVKDIGVYTQNEAKNFVKSRLKNIKESDTQEILELVSDLGYLPLAITTTVSFLNVNTDITVKEYRQRFNTQLISTTGQVDGYERTISKTWEIVKERLEKDSPEIVLLYQVLSFFDGQSIKLPLLFQDVPDIIKGKSISSSFPIVAEKIFGDKEYGIRNAITQLKEYSLINVESNYDNTKVIKIHSLMQLVTRLELGKKSNPDERLTTAYIALRTMHNLQESEERTGDISKRTFFDYGQEWLPHVVQLVRSCRSRGFEVILSEYVCLDKDFLLKHALLSKGYYQTCQEMFQIFSSSVTGVDEGTLLEINYICAYSILKNGKYKTAREEFENLLQKGTFPEDRKLEMQYFIGHCLMKSESYDEAIESLTEVQHSQLERYSEHSGPYLLTCHDIAYCKFKLARYEEAFTEYQRILPFQRKHVGAYHKDTLLTSHSLGHCLIDMGRYQEAKESLEETLAKKTKAFGELHHETLITHHTLGLVLMHLKDYQQAESIFGKVFENKKKAMGPSHPSTLVTHHRVANCHLRQQNVNEALSVFQEVYEKRKEVLGPEKERTLLTRNDIAMCHIENKDYDKAIEILEEVYETQERLFTKKKVSTFTTKLNLALCYKDRPNEEKLADYQKASEMLQDVLGLQEDHYGVNSDKPKMTMVHLATCQDFLNETGKKEK